MKGFHFIRLALLLPALLGAASFLVPQALGQGAVPSAKAAPVAEDLKAFKKRRDAMLKVLHADPVDLVKLEAEARALIRDFPVRSGGYWCNGFQTLMIVVEHYERADVARAREIARDVQGSAVASPAMKLWFAGVLRRLEPGDAPPVLAFTALDGRAVDVAKLKGQVVLVDFWATTCGPCVAELPKLKAVYEKLHAQGFEIIGVSFDTEEKELRTFVKRKAIPWPQSFEGKRVPENRFGQAYGIDGIPHMVMFDRTGRLRFDHLRAEAVEKLVEQLLAEP